VIHTLLFHIDCTPFSSVFNPTNNGIHVYDAFSNTLFIIESFSNKVANKISEENFPRDIPSSPSINEMYVTKFSSNKISIIATSIPIQQHQK
jgi:DNA-binding beta-propeller fold protein YncE